MIFVSVGSQFPFDRLIEAIDTAMAGSGISEKVIAQVGLGNYKSEYMTCFDFIGKEKYEKYMKEASYLISHAGIGNISTALRYGKPILVMPRMKKYGEHVNDHQVGTAQKYEALGHVLAAYDSRQMIDKIRQLKTFVPKERVADVQKVVSRIDAYIGSL